MKANNGKGNTVLRDDWETPSEIYDPLNKQFHFLIDCCANYKNTKTATFYDDFESIRHEIKDICWMNPPFSKAWNMISHFFKVVKKGVFIYRCDNLETGIWQKIIHPNCDWIFIPRGRVNYEGLDGSGARFPSALVGVGLKYPKYIEGIILFC
ncbi:MAG: DNA N-6-adenine-methyltransferase [Candidatus Thorarchaeota archaeon]